VSGSDKEVKNLRDKFRKGLPNLNNTDIHVLCSYLKDLIRMQENLISPSDLSKLTVAIKNKNDVSKSLCQVVSELPHTNRNILAFLILHLQKYILINNYKINAYFSKNYLISPFFRVAISSKCNMDYKCLAIIFGPTIVGVPSASLDELHIKSEIVFEVSDQVFH